MKKLLKVLVLMIGIIILNPCMVDVCYAEESDIEGIIRCYLCENETDEIFVEKEYLIKNFSENVTARYIDTNRGYVIVSVDEELCVKEYSKGDNVSFIDAAIKEITAEYKVVDEVEIYTDGGVLYYLRFNDEDKLYSITTSDIQIFELDDLIEQNKDDKTTSSTYVSGYINNPKSYESLYYDRIVKNVPNYSMRYFYMDDFRNAGGVYRENHCSPTAATNMMLYWYTRDTSKYASLKLLSWEQTFIKFHSLFGTTNSRGTSVSKLESGYFSYMYHTCGVVATCTLIKNPTVAQMKSEIDAGYPFHLNVYNHNLYKNHSLFALGYERYYYRNGDIELYLRVADGWYPYPTRYVLVTDERITKDMVKVRPR